MRINFEKLTEDFFVSFKSKGDKLLEVGISPRQFSDTASDMLKEVAAIEGFNELETEYLFNEVSKIAIMSAIRKCSNW